MNLSNDIENVRKSFGTEEERSHCFTDIDIDAYYDRASDRLSKKNIKTRLFDIDWVCTVSGVVSIGMLGGICLVECKWT